MMSGDCPWFVRAVTGNVTSGSDFTLQKVKPLALHIQQIQEQGRIISGSCHITVTTTEAKTPSGDQPLRMIPLSSCSNGKGETVEPVLTHPSVHQALASF